MLLIIGCVVGVAMVGVLVGAMLWPRGPVKEPSPRPKRDDRVAVLEGGSGRGWD